MLPAIAFFFVVLGAWLVATGSSPSTHRRDRMLHIAVGLCFLLLGFTIGAVEFVKGVSA